MNEFGEQIMLGEMFEGLMFLTKDIKRLQNVELTDI